MIKVSIIKDKMVESTNKKSSQDGILILLGGSSFMGLTLLRQLAEQGAHRVVVVNRGNSYWANESGEIIAKHASMIHHVKLDRKDSTRSVETLSEVLLEMTKDGTKIDSVVDFSCFKP